MGMDNEIDYSECTQNVPKFSYNIQKVFSDLSLNIKYLCKYFFYIKQLRITLLPNKVHILWERKFFELNQQFRLNMYNM